MIEENKTTAERYKVLDVREVFVPYTNNRDKVETMHRFIFILENIHGRRRKEIESCMINRLSKSEHSMVVVGDEIELEITKELGVPMYCIRIINK